MGLHNLLIRLTSGVSDTPDTPEESPGYQRKPSNGAGCTLDTSDTSVIDSTRERAGNEFDPDRPDGQGSGKVSNLVSTEMKVSGGKVTGKVTAETEVRNAEVRGAVRTETQDFDRWAWPQCTTMTGAEIDTFTARRARFNDKGLSLIDAEALADELVFRDREGDDRRVCLECVHLRRGGRCGNWKASEVASNAMDARLPGDFTTMLQRCGGFTEGTR